METVDLREDLQTANAPDLRLSDFPAAGTLAEGHAVSLLVFGGAGEKARASEGTSTLFTPRIRLGCSAADSKHMSFKVWGSQSDLCKIIKPAGGLSCLVEMGSHLLNAIQMKEVPTAPVDGLSLNFPSLSGEKSSDLSGN
ncbi:unnamed protein product [Pleuronectes platessa]|uniref:Uncharacterized protein n=1 Tax=Pleuronectes platessa TaxID=8262 RepID=A0A9N7VJ09_PLEPL|nr:unnamed protein product [Pleuronectes platessa]